MRCILVLALIATLANAAQTRFAGEWLATHNGTTICTIDIVEDGGKISGESKSCRVSVDQNGDLIDAGAPDGSEPSQPFINPKIVGETLAYQLQEDNGDRMKFQFKLTGTEKYSNSSEPAGPASFL